MKLPSKKSALVDEAKHLSKLCFNSQSERIDQYARWRNYLYAGNEDLSKPAIMNKTGSHATRMSAFLFSPAETHFNVEFGPDAAPEWRKREPVIGQILTDEFHAAQVDIAFSEAVYWSLPFGACFLKLLWRDNKGLDPYVVMPNQIGVYREDVNGLNRQEVISHVTYLTPYELWRRVHKMDNVLEIMSSVTSYSADRTQDDIDNIVHQVIIGGITPVTTGSPSGTRGSVDVFNAMGTPNIPQDIATSLIRFVELWIIDDDTGDYTTLQYAEPDVLIEGGLQKRNIYLPGQQPFILVQPNEQKGYFWGRSEFSDLYYMQDIITDRLNDIAHIWRLRAQPPRGLIGFTALTDEARRAFSTPDGLVMNDNPNSKIENLAPELPPDAFQQVESVMKYFDEVAGFPPILQGQGEPGVRAGMHADTLSRTASGPIRNKALKVERTCAETGELALELLADKEAKAYGPDGQEYLLDQTPDDRKVTVDSHSSSPAFTQDLRTLAFSLKKVGAITNEGLLMMLNPPKKDLLLEQLKQEKEAELKFALEHPELAQKKGGRRR